MQCEYCGRQNESTAASCGGCGTPIPTALAVGGIAGPTEVPPLLEVPRLNASRATGVLLIYFGAQLIAGFLVGMVSVIALGVHGKRVDVATQMPQIQQRIMAPAMAFSVVGGGLAMVWASVLMFRSELRKAGPEAAAWLPGAGKDIAKGLGLGFLAGFAYLVIASVAAGAGAEPGKLGPLATMAATPGVTRLLWFSLALVFAPPFEELLFRGIMYGGYRRSLGPTKAAILTTAIFVLLHVGEWMYFLPAALGITGLAVLALWMRVRSGAIGPSIAAHLGYNTAVALAEALSAVVSSAK